MSKLLLLISCSFVCALNIGCSSLTHKRTAMTGIAFGVGTSVGYVSAPDSEKKEMHGFFWGAFSGLTAALISNYIYNEETAITTLQSENEKLKAEMQMFQNANKVLVSEGQGYFKTTQGETLFDGKKTKWKIYKVDKWIKETDQKLIHVDKAVEMDPL